MKQCFIQVGLLLILFQNCLSQDYPDEIIFHSNGSTFSPIITVQGNSEIIWTFDDSTTSSSPQPIKDYGFDGLRKNRLKVIPWSAVKGINIGYDAKDDGSDTISLVANQKVSEVEHMDLVAPYLELWCSSYNLLDSLIFDNFINLKTIECYKSTSVKYISLKNTPNLKRLCLEDNDLDTLDISACTGLEDFRAALNNYTNVIFSNSTEELWHICIRGNNQIENNYMFADLEIFPLLRELWIWDTNQMGIFRLQSSLTDKISIHAFDNNYYKLDLSGALQKETSWAIVNFNNNQLESVNVSGCKQIYDLYLRNNNLLPDSVDKVLFQMDELGDLGYTDYRSVDLRDNSMPTSVGLLYKANLEAKGWTVYVQTGCEINISGNGIAITNGDITPNESDFTDFDSVEVNSDKVVHTFIIKNNGTTPLELFRDSALIFIGGINASNFILISEPDSIIAIGDSTAFQIAFTPSEIGILTATVSISNNDWDSNPFTFNIQGTGVTLTNLEGIASTPTNSELSQNYPNPFNPSTKINWYSPIDCWHTLAVFDILGNRVLTLVDEFRTSGEYNYILNVSDLSIRNSNLILSSGIYFYQLKAGNYVSTKKMILLR